MRKLMRSVGMLSAAAVLVAAVVVALPCLGEALSYGAYVMGVIGHLIHRPSVAEVTAPLDRHIIDDLCTTFSIANQDARCQRGALVYAPDFFPEVRAAFTPGSTTLQEVERAIGRYEVNRTAYDPAPERAALRVDYDFSGDGAYGITMLFTKAGVLRALHAQVGDVLP